MPIFPALRPLHSTVCTLRSRRLADREGVRHDAMQSLVWGCDPVEERSDKFDCRVSEFRRVDGDARELRRHEGSDIEAIDADDGNVARDADMCTRETLQHPDGQYVVKGKYRIGLGVLLPQAGGSTHSPVVRVGRDELGIGRPVKAILTE